MFYRTDNLRDDVIFLKCTEHFRGTGRGDMDFLPAYIFEICRLSDGKQIGTCDLRIGHNKNTYYGGNIGYRVFSEYRGNRIASRATKLMYPLARLHGMEYLDITCHPENIPSRKTIEKAGAEFLDIIDVPRWHHLYHEGQVRTCLYRVYL